MTTERIRGLPVFDVGATTLVLCHPHRQLALTFPKSPPPALGPILIFNLLYYPASRLPELLGPQCEFTR